MMEPMLKYPGGKRALLPVYRQYLPKSTAERRFIEPMCGGMAASLAWCHEFESVNVCDANADLIAFYADVIHGDGLARLRAEAARYNAGKDTDREDLYYEWRAKVGKDPVAFWLVNRTTFNGLVRYNQRGKFNAPWGKVKLITPEVLAHVANVATNLRHLAFTLHAPTKVADFIAGFEWRAGDVAFFDPPYYGGFSSYTAAGFDLGDHARLAAGVATLREKGVYCLVSNSNHPQIRQLYAGILRPVEVSAARIISQDASKRGDVTELLFVPEGA